MPLVPILVAVAVMVVWGATPIATRLALDDLQPLFVACLRTVFAGLVAIPLLAGMRQGIPAEQPLARPCSGSRRRSVSSIFPIVYTVGQQRTSALHGVMILAALPIFTGAYAALVSAARRGGPGCSAAPSRSSARSC